MNVITLPAAGRHSAACLVVFTDLQLEYVATGRAYSLRDTDGCLANCARLLKTVRDLGLPIAHFRQIRPDAYFNRDCRFSQWIEDFRPNANESVYERSMPSCYASKAFSDFIDNIADPLIVVAGFSSEQSGLATAIDAYHRHHRMVFVSDCAATAPIADLSEQTAHAVLCDIISRYAEVSSSDRVLTQLSKVQRSRFRGQK
jgi:nicotinamidase-related amidase